jgi:4-amino-4-deoxy-L-arabinose transferase-like glycosyltransferase
MESPASNTYRTVSLIFVVLIAALLLRITNLEADPSALISRDYITDEGQWSHNARNQISFGQSRLDDYNPGLYSAYLYHQLLQVSFSLRGASLEAQRLVSAIAGWLSVVLLFCWVRREANTKTALIASMLLGLSNLHALYSRTGFVESTMVFFMALMVWLWSLKARHAIFAFLSGVAFGLMLLTKVTAIYLAPGVALLAAAEIIRKTISLREALMFFFGAGILVSGFILFFFVPNATDFLNYNVAAGLDNEFPRQTSDLILSFLRVIVWRFFARTPILTGLTLVALAGFVVRISSQGLTVAIRETGKLEMTSISLLVGYLFSIGLTVYQPERRFLPALFFMTALSASVLDRGWGWFEKVVSNQRVGADAWFLLLFSLPSLIVLEFKSATLGSPLTFRFWLLRGSAIALLGFIGIAISRGRFSSASKTRLLTVSKFTFVLLFSGLSIGLVYQSLVLWGLSIELRIVSFILCGVLLSGIMIGVRDTKFQKPAFIIIAAFITIEGLQISTWLLQPTYTIKQANETLSSMIGKGESVVTRYETLFMATEARIVCYWPKAGFNVNAFESGNPSYELILTTDNWAKIAREAMPSDEWPLPTKEATFVSSFDLCPTRSRGSRFTVELYELHCNANP